MCAKQCRDANGFKCHQTSASHLKMMSILREEGGKIVDDFSKEFEDSYVDTLRRRHGVKRVNANNVYQEVIADKHHIHMNATQWETLTSFVQYLGKKGTIIVEEDERGWFVQYIDRNVDTLRKKAVTEERLRAEREEEEKERRKLERRIREAAKAGVGTEEREATGIDKSKKVGGVVLGGAEKGGKRKLGGSGFKSEKRARGEEEAEKEEKVCEGAKPMSALDRMMIEDRARKVKETEEKERKERVQEEEDEKKRKREKREKREKKAKKKDYWLKKGIVVKVTNKKLEGGKFYKFKGVVKEVQEKYAGLVNILDDSSGIELLLDQDDLETVIPKAGKMVTIVNGYGRGEDAEMVEVLEKEYKGRLRLEDGEIVDADYECFSRKYTD